MTLTRATMLFVCILLVCIGGVSGKTNFPLLAAQTTPIMQSLQTQQAVEQQVQIQHAEKLAQLEAEVKVQRDIIADMRDQIATQRGIGMGFAALLGLLQSIQMVLQVKAARKS